MSFVLLISTRNGTIIIMIIAMEMLLAEPDATTIYRRLFIITRYCEQIEILYLNDKKLLIRDYGIIYFWTFIVPHVYICIYVYKKTVQTWRSGGKIYVRYPGRAAKHLERVRYEKKKKEKKQEEKYTKYYILHTAKQILYLPAPILLSYKYVLKTNIL